MLLFALKRGEILATCKLLSSYVELLKVARSERELYQGSVAYWLQCFLESNRPRLDPRWWLALLYPHISEYNYISVCTEESGNNGCSQDAPI